MDRSEPRLRGRLRSLARRQGTLLLGVLMLQGRWSGEQASMTALPRSVHRCSIQPSVFDERLWPTWATSLVRRAGLPERSARS